MNAPQRTELVLTAAERTPWGIADGATQYGPGLVFYYTPSHGGFHVEPDLLATMPAHLRSIRPFCGQEGWYEEDCDYALVALAFPDRFHPDELSAAGDIFKAHHAKHLTREHAALCLQAATQAPPPTGQYKRPGPAPVEGRDWICTGNFDGSTCGSDADPGL